MILGVGAGLTFVIFVHELGHFLVAKACGVKCEKFYVGFDFFEIPIPFTTWKIPRSLIKFQWGETEYGLGSLPLGGYVKMLGQDDDPRNAEAEAARIQMAASSRRQSGRSSLLPAKTVEGKTVLLDPRSYPAKPVPARMAIISAGVDHEPDLRRDPGGGRVSPRRARDAGHDRRDDARQSRLGRGNHARQQDPARSGAAANPYEHLRFEDLTTSVILNGSDRDLPFLIRRPDGQEVWYEIRPSDRLKPITKRPTIGISPEPSREVERATHPDRRAP